MKKLGHISWLFCLLFATTLFCNAAANTTSILNGSLSSSTLPMNASSASMSATLTPTSVASAAASSVGPRQTMRPSSFRTVNMVSSSHQSSSVQTSETQSTEATSSLLPSNTPVNYESTSVIATISSAAPIVATSSVAGHQSTPTVTASSGISSNSSRENGTEQTSTAMEVSTFVSNSQLSPTSVNSAMPTSPAMRTTGTVFAMTAGINATPRASTQAPTQQTFVTPSPSKSASGDPEPTPYIAGGLSCHHCTYNESKGAFCENKVLKCGYKTTRCIDYHIYYKNGTGLLGKGCAESKHCEENACMDVYNRTGAVKSCSIECCKGNKCNFSSNASCPAFEIAFLLALISSVCLLA